MKLFFVCSGNTCRSPMAEAAFEYMLKKEGIEGVEVQSRGVVAAVGKPMSANAVTALEKRGIPVKEHVATQITTDDLLAADLVICMAERHKLRLGCLPKVFTLGQLTSAGDVPDPFGGDQKTYDDCLDEILKDLEKLIPLIKRQLTL